MAEDNDKRKPKAKNLDNGFKKLYEDSKKLNPKLPRKRLTEQQMNKLRSAIESRVGEFMDTYMLIGFCLNNDQEIIMYNEGSSDKDRRALDSLIQDYYKNQQMDSDIISFDFNPDDDDSDEDDDDDDDESWK